jgi:hypothetical protein
MPAGCPAGSAVLIQQLDDKTWLVKRQVQETSIKMVALRTIETLPDDPEREEIEARLARETSTRLKEPR